MKRNTAILLIVTAVTVIGVLIGLFLGAGEGIETKLTLLRTNDKGYKEYRNEKDGNILIYIPAGEFTMGSNDNNDEKPIHKVYLDGYYIMKYEVTNKQFVDFLNANKNKITFKDTTSQDNYSTKVAQINGDNIYEIYWDGYNKTESLKNWVIPIIFSNGSYECVKGYENHPVVNVSWQGAQAYSTWAGLRLPTEAEWEKASRGKDSRIYPWGDGEPLTNRCNYDGSGDGYEYTSPIGAYENGRSPYGCYDMSGNVWEWCSDWYGDNYYKDSEYKNPKGPDSGFLRILRGGSWYRLATFASCAFRNNGTSSNVYNDSGFRCAASKI